jgi:hypothetical protein
MCLLVKVRAFQFFFAVAMAFLSTADGHVTVLLLATTADWEKARAVGERVSDYCLGNPNYRMITIIRFIRKHGPIVQEIAMAVVRHRVTEAAKRLQSRYDANKIMRDARQDIFTVTDFDGTVSAQLGEPAGVTDFCVFVFGRPGELLAQWHDVPGAKQFAAVVR